MVRTIFSLFCLVQVIGLATPIINNTSWSAIDTQQIVEKAGVSEISVLNISSSSTSLSIGHHVNTTSDHSSDIESPNIDGQSAINNTSSYAADTPLPASNGNSMYDNYEYNATLPGSNESSIVELPLADADILLKKLVDDDQHNALYLWNMAQTVGRYVKKTGATHNRQTRHGKKIYQNIEHLCKETTSAGMLMSYSLSSMHELFKEWNQVGFIRTKDIEQLMKLLDGSRSAEAVTYGSNHNGSIARGFVVIVKPEFDIPGFDENRGTIAFALVRIQFLQDVRNPLTSMNDQSSSGGGLMNDQDRNDLEAYLSLKAKKLFRQKNQPMFARMNQEKCNRYKDLSTTWKNIFRRYYQGGIFVDTNVEFTNGFEAQFKCFDVCKEGGMNSFNEYSIEDNSRKLICVCYNTCNFE